jgi:hypothetical protein
LGARGGQGGERKRVLATKDLGLSRAHAAAGRCGGG